MKSSRKEAEEPKKGPRAARPPENLKTAASSSASNRENWRERAINSPKGQKAEPPPGTEVKSSEKGAVKPSRQARIVVEDDSDSEEEKVVLPRIVEAESESPSREKPKKSAMKSVEDRAYTLVSKFDDPKIIKSLVDKTEQSVLDGVTVGDLVAMSPEYAKELRKTVSRTRQPLKPAALLGMIGQGEAELPFMDDGDVIPQAGDPEVINIEDLPVVDSFFVATAEDIGLQPGGLVATDPVLQYYSSLESWQTAKPVCIPAPQTSSIRVLFPIVNNVGEVESIVDSGSQIVSMSQHVAEQKGVMWDPDLPIYMQSANGNMQKTAGLARNVPFLFADLAIYLQVHVIPQAAYDILLGRPFDILTASTVQNRTDGTQTVTIKDPGSKRRITLPTHEKGKFTKYSRNDWAYAQELLRVPRILPESEVARETSGETVFRSSSRN